MRKTEFVHTYFCDLCGEQAAREMLETVYGKYGDDRSSCPHFDVDICVKCQRLTIGILLDRLRNNR